MYVVEISCLLLSVLGVVGACKGKRWCLILVKKHTHLPSFHLCRTVFIQVFSANDVSLMVYVCSQYATGMAAASQTIIVRTALSYQDVYEVKYLNALLLQLCYLKVLKSSFNYRMSVQCDFSLLRNVWRVRSPSCSP